MTWEMGSPDIDAAMEKIGDLHDKLSNAIHSISKAHFFRSISRRSQGPDEERRGFVYVKGFPAAEEGEAAVREAKSLNAIRTALENLEDQLEFLNAVQSQQQAERDAAIARLEQSRIILAIRLADHQGKKYKVIDEALAFVGDVHGTGGFVAPESLLDKARNQSGDKSQSPESEGRNIFMQILTSGITLTKKSLKLGMANGLLGNTALFAVSMLAVFQLHQATLKGGILSGAPSLQASSSRNAIGKYGALLKKPSTENDKTHHLDVFSARG